MNLYMFLLTMALVFPLLIYSDTKARLKAEQAPDAFYDLNKRSTISVILFTPFAALFYTENFWSNLLYFIPLYLYFWLLMYLANKKNWFPSFSSEVPMYGAMGFFITVIGYFIGFHEGIMVDEPVSGELENPDPAVWPYYAFAVIGIVTLIIALIEALRGQKIQSSALMVFIMAVVYPLLPLFTATYWWGLLGGFLVFSLLMPISLSRLPGDVKGGIGFFMGYSFMMATSLSILLYAFLF